MIEKTTLVYILIIVLGLTTGIVLSNIAGDTDWSAPDLKLEDTEDLRVDSAEVDGENITYVKGNLNDIKSNWRINGYYLSRAYWLNGTNNSFNTKGVDKGVVVLFRGSGIERSFNPKPGKYDLYVSAAKVDKLEPGSTTEACPELKMTITKNGNVIAERTVNSTQEYKEFKFEDAVEVPLQNILFGEKVTLGVRNAGTADCASQLEYLGVDKIKLERTSYY